MPSPFDEKEAIEACIAAVKYDDAIRACANDPRKMSSFCTAEGEDLDALYMDWMNKARTVVNSLPQGGGK